MTWTIIHIIDMTLWLFMAGSVVYVLFFAVASKFNSGKTQRRPRACNDRRHTFLVLFPAYNEDNVITTSVSAFLNQDYPADHYHVAVISDHMRNDTNNKLSLMPITLHKPVFENSSKAKALQYAMANCDRRYDFVVVLDADNVVNSDFLIRLNTACQYGYSAIQCHRLAKNTDNDIAVLDGLSEEINNTIFRKAHNNIGLSSALIGSGMCFDFKWFTDNVRLLSTAGEDKELEALLLMQGTYIKYEEDIAVFDEKVASKDNFQQQRRRWMTAQIQCLSSMLPHVPAAIRQGNIDYIDKTVQQMLIPRSILIAAILFFAGLSLVAVPVWSMKWWALLAVLCLSVIMSIPGNKRFGTTLRKVTAMPNLVWKMLANIRHIDKNDTTFTHTRHER